MASIRLLKESDNLSFSLREAYLVLFIELKLPRACKHFVLRWISFWLFSKFHTTVR